MLLNIFLTEVNKEKNHMIDLKANVTKTLPHSTTNKVKTWLSASVEEQLLIVFFLVQTVE